MFFICVTRPRTSGDVLGFATSPPISDIAAITTADADGIIIAGLLFDAGPIRMTCPAGSRTGWAARPVTRRIPSRCMMSFFGWAALEWDARPVNLKINSSDTIIDHTWIGRADHGSGVGWDMNTSANGLVVNGNNVTAYGLFVEHLQFQVLNGDEPTFINLKFRTILPTRQAT